MTDSSPAFDSEHGAFSRDAWRFGGVMRHRLTTGVIFLGLQPSGNDRRLGYNPIYSSIQYRKIGTNDIISVT